MRIEAEIEMNGRKYRCLRLPVSNHDKGHWEFQWKDSWHRCINYTICFELNQKLNTKQDPPMQDPQLSLFP